MRIQNLLLPVLLAPMLATVTGCTPPASATPASPTALTARQQSQMDIVRQQMDLIPPPSKTRYMAVRSLTTWENPYLTVQGQMLTLHVMTADPSTTALGDGGGILRPTGARRHDLNIRTTELADALNSIPQNAWPYGRVVALEEAHDAPPAARPQVRRNMEAAIKTLSDLGVVVYDWADATNPLR